MWWPVAEEQLKELRELAFSFKGGPKFTKVGIDKTATLLFRQQKIFFDPPPITDTPYPLNRLNLVLKSVFLNKINTLHVSVVILWLPTFYDPPVFFPKSYEPPVYLGPPFWRKCQPRNVWCSGLQTTDQVTRGKGLFCCPKDACQKSCRQQLTLADKIKLGYTERL